MSILMQGTRPWSFGDVPQGTSFYPGINGTGRYGKSFRLALATQVKIGGVALSFTATAISKNGILFSIGEDEPVSFKPPWEKMSEVTDVVEGNPAEIAVSCDYYFASRNSGRGEKIRAYVRKAGRLV